MSLIDFVRGTVAERGVDGVVLIVGGFGVRILTAPTTANRLPDPGGEGTVYTHLQVREDALTLYGFATRAERSLFTQLLGVSGIGPKVAMGMLAASAVERLAALIAAGDVDGLAKLPGIGKRTAQRIVLDLKGKIDLPEAAAILAASTPAGPTSVYDTVAQALADWGNIPPARVAAVVAALPRDRELSEQEALALAFRMMGQQS